MYRFRPMSSLLGDFQELEKQEIYFASPQQLNDPLEGAVKVFWKGDRVVWRNFFRHYILCLTQQCMAALLYDHHEAAFYQLEIPMQMQERLLPTDQYRELVRAAQASFLATRKAEETIEALATPYREVEEDELYVLLVPLQTTALRCVFEQLISQGVHKDDGITEYLKKSEAYPPLPPPGSLSEEDRAVLFKIARNILDEVILMATVRSPHPDGKNKLAHLSAEFPKRYLQSFVYLTYPRWYAACFMTQCTDATIWANYADNHRGACLIFNTRQRDGAQFLPLTMTHGDDNGDSRGDVREHLLRPIQYTNEWTRLDAFRSLLTLSVDDIYTNWYRDEDGTVSCCAEMLEEFRADKDKGRQQYWDLYDHINGSKATDWAAECEHRIVLSEFFYRYQKQESRLLRYDFADLKGIIFGMNTTSEDKAAIMGIIQRKCRESKRTDFEFHQATPSRERRELEIHKLGLIKFKV